MKMELISNAEKKGDFDLWEPAMVDVIREIEHHVEKLKKAEREGSDDEIKEYAADIANYCMKAYEIA
jgi:hypothetical protein